MKAYVLLNKEIGYENTVIQGLQDIAEITNIYLVYGIYDIVIETETRDITELNNLIFNKIRKNRYVKGTQTFPVVH